MEIALAVLIVSAAAAWALLRSRPAAPVATPGAPPAPVVSEKSLLAALAAKVGAAKTGTTKAGQGQLLINALDGGSTPVRITSYPDALARAGISRDGASSGPLDPNAFAARLHELEAKNDTPEAVAEVAPVPKFGAVGE